jgi:acetyl esterase
VPGLPGGLHPQVASVLTSQAPPAPGAGTDLAALRASYGETARRLGGIPEPVAETRDLLLDGTVPARVYRPLEPAPGPAGCALWLHGGGWVMGDLDGFDPVCRALANAGGHTVVSVDYRLAPEHPFPAGLDDARTALAWVRGPGAEELGHDPGRIVIGGDSAGGNLATVAARDGGARLQLLVYPVTDGELDTTSYRAGTEGPLLTRAEMESCWAAYVAPGDRLGPDASPLRAAPDLLATGPPAVVAVCGFDVLRDEGLAYAQKLRAAGVPTELVDFPDMVHGFLRWGGAVDRAGELVGLLGARMRAALA